ncbi:MipA/OmpV family protein [Roseivivax sp. GX 12232]|uniref:MipA/OmpV family protein n=1 Tax=Roseivivax sp. GX 12232 TaxID=2900547 RepID=UPI001E5A2C61|nr:MipA/OmpV family protein [Roseivivax sp. GX 12232]MCE0505976.1 MipA/OmpV family protein [Roseivivax sp. GX 12232]
MLRSLLAVPALAACLTTPAFAQSGSDAPALSFTLRGGVASGPAYFGAEEYEVKPDIGFGLQSANIGPLRFGDPDPQAEKTGLGLRGSFRYIAARDASEHDLLTGLDDIDAAVELGLGLGYASEHFMAFADLRQGFGGHTGVVAEAGADAIFRASPELTLTAGPRVLFGNGEYTDTYFGVSGSEASALNPAYDADGGLVSAGMEFGAIYQIDENWGVETAVTWDRYMNDAADSPIVDNGRRDDWGARVGLTRSIQIGR